MSKVRCGPTGRVLASGIYYHRTQHKYHVNIMVDGKAQTAAYGINKYGEKEAYRLTQKKVDDLNKMNAEDSKNRYGPSGRILPTGVYYNKSQHKYHVSLTVHGKTYTASYTIYKYGENEAYLLAEKRLDELNEEAIDSSNNRYGAAGRILPFGIYYSKRLNSYKVRVTINGKLWTSTF